MRSTLVHLFGFRAMLVHGDTGVLDRYVWLSNRLRKTDQVKTLIDVGCGSGAFTIGAALRGYECVGLDVVENNILKARERGRLLGVSRAFFEALDVSRLEERGDLLNRFDTAICLEVVEHILDDRRFVRDVAACLKPGGRLLLTTPNLEYRAITRGDNGPWPQDGGGHKRKGYDEDKLVKLILQAGLICDGISWCTGFLSQKITWISRTFGRLHPFVGWAVILPLRIVPPLFDPWLTRVVRWPWFSICVEAHKPN